MKYVIFLLCSLVFNMANAEDMPKGSSYDKRMQRVGYNAENVIKINTQLF